MNDFCTKKVHDGVTSFVRGKNHRVKNLVPLTSTQIDFARHVFFMRRKVAALPEGIWLFGAGGETAALFRFTSIGEKCIGGILETNPCNAFYDEWHHQKYDVTMMDRTVVAGIQDILIADFVHVDEWKHLLERYGFSGKFHDIYDEVQDVPFGCVACGTKLLQDGGDIHVPQYLSWRDIHEDEIAFVKRVDKIHARLAPWRDKKLIVYPAGGHTENLLGLTDLCNMHIIGLADRDVRDFHGKPVLPAVKETFEQAEGIVVSTYALQEKLADYLTKLGQADKIITLYDAQDPCEFYWNYNTMAPDLPAGDLFRPYPYSRAEVLLRAEKAMQDLTCNSDYYLTYQMDEDFLRLTGSFYQDDPDVTRLKDYRAANAQVGWILQGPVVYEQAFTYRTIVGYLRKFPGATILLSTWAEENQKQEFQAFKKLPIEIVLNDPPQERGTLNVNMQIRSTMGGIERANQLKLPYVFKARTDFRIQETGILTTLVEFLRRYPVHGMGRQQERLAVLPPYLEVPYYIPDFLMFGRTEDMQTFWQEGTLPADRYPCNPEVSLFERYFQHLHAYIEDPLHDFEDYAQLLADRLLVLNQNMFHAIWRKYTYEIFERQEVAHNRFYFADWLRRQPR